MAEALVSRSAVDLKDKWRNLLRIAMLPVLYKRREATEVPTELLARVKLLAAHKGSAAGCATGRGREEPDSADAADDAAERERRRSDDSESGDAVGVGGGGELALALGGGGNKGGARRSKHHSPWTLTESQAGAFTRSLFSST